MYPIAFIGSLGPVEMMVVGMIALLLFGKKLPQVARDIGRSFTEFKKGVSGIEDNVTRSTSSYQTEPTARIEETAAV